MVKPMKNIQIEYSELENKLKEVQSEISELKKGNLRKKTINGREYYYLQYRQDGHIRSDYIRYDSVNNIKIEIEHRKELERTASDLEHRLLRYAMLMGIHRSYHPIKNIDYSSYTLFMSTVAHDYKKMELDDFVKKYNTAKFRGLNKRYLAGFYDYINGIDRSNMRKTNDLVLDPYTYVMYFKYNNKEVLDEELKRAIPAFLNRGLLITDIKKTLDGAFETATEEKILKNSIGDYNKTGKI